MQSSLHSNASKNKPTILVTAADSYAGATLVNHLADFGHKRFHKIVLVVGTNSTIDDRIDTSHLENIEIKRLNLEQPNTSELAQALVGVDTLAMIPPTRANKWAVSRALLRAAEDADVQNCVLLTWTGTHALGDTDESTGKAFPQLTEVRKLENHFTNDATCKIPNKCIVRANWYAQNLLTYAKQIVEDGQLPIPTGPGKKIAPLDAEILGRVLANILVAHPMAAAHRNQTFTLTGNQAVDADEMAELLGRAIGHEVRAKRVSLDEARSLLERAQPPLDKTEIETIVETYSLIDQGRMDQISTDLVRDLDLIHLPLIETLKREVPMFAKVSSR